VRAPLWCVRSLYACPLYRNYEHLFRPHLVGCPSDSTVMNVFPANRPVVAIRPANTPRVRRVTLCTSAIHRSCTQAYKSSKEFATLHSLRSSGNLTPSPSPPSLPTSPRFTILQITANRQLAIPGDNRDENGIQHDNQPQHRRQLQHQQQP
jgi:hypothetical protein